MNEIFNFHGQEVRTLTIDDEPWFVGKDVADILGYSKARNAIALHVDEDDALKQGLTDNLGRVQETIIINESGLYSLILSSKLPQAKEFKRWVTSEVLPAIRKQGGFIREDLDEDAFIALFTGQKKLREQQATMLEDIDYLKSEQPIHPSYAQSLLKKRKARVVACLGGIDSPAYADKIFAQSVFRQAEIDFKDHFNISRYDLLPKKHADAALAYWMTWEPSTNTKMKIMELNAFSQAKAKTRRKKMKKTTYSSMYLATMDTILQVFWLTWVHRILLSKFLKVQAISTLACPLKLSNQPLLDFIISHGLEVTLKKPNERHATFLIMYLKK
ncbi:BRO family, N-terminal domain protein [Streptococcus sp. M334]|nr:BRO family, N-terminal domain protein [Streptococcus sp. M334]